MSSLKKHKRKSKDILFLHVYAKYKSEFLNPGVRRQEVWKKIAREMDKKGSYNYRESYWYRKLRELRQDYEDIKHIPARNEQMADFKTAAKNAFQTIENPVTGVPNKVKKAMQTGKQLNNNFYCEDLYYTVNGRPVYLEKVKDKKIEAVQNEVKMSLQMQKKQLDKERQFLQNTALLIIYTSHKDEFNFHVNVESVWGKIAEKMKEKFPNFKCSPKQCRDKVLTMKKQYERIKDKNSKVVTNTTNDIIFMSKAKLAFDTKEHPVTFMNNHKTKKQLALLKAFNMYKAQFLSPDANEQELWEKITETVNKLSIQDKPYSVSDFRNHIRCLKIKYDNLKSGKKDIAIPENAVYFEEAKLVFESTGSEAISVDQILHGSGLLERYRQKFERNLALLRAYNIYKAEFSSTNEDDEDVWKKITGTVRISCSWNEFTINDCRMLISRMKSQYENKQHDWYLFSQPDSDILFEEEKLAFEPITYTEELEQMDLLTEISTDSI